MKIKLIKVKTLTETVTWNYGDDYSDVRRHLVEDYSDFEEVDIPKFSEIEGWVGNYNLNTKKNGEYIIIVIDEIITVKSVIDDIIQKSKVAEQKRLNDEKVRREKAEEDKKNRAANKLKKLERQLEKARKEAQVNV